MVVQTTCPWLAFGSPLKNNGKGHYEANRGKYLSIPKANPVPKMATDRFPFLVRNLRQESVFSKAPPLKGPFEQPSSGRAALTLGPAR